MNFADNLQDAAFRGECREWIAANAPHALAPQLKELGFAPNWLRGADLLTESRLWQKRKAEAGWACIHWPRKFGGRDASPVERIIFKQEEGCFSHLSHLFFIGQNMCGPTLMEFATDAQKQHYLPDILSGKSIWCQLFSEPAAGSDLAAVNTRAVKQGDEWVINGQKVWTSGGHISDFGLLLTRTHPDRPKHKGLTMFFIDMRSTGITIRPIHQADGGAEFNEVFLADLRVPDAQRLGQPGEGWTVALSTLMNERLSHGTGMPTGFGEVFDLWSGIGGNDPALRSRMADLAARDCGLRTTGFRLVAGLKPGELPGAESSIGKLVAGAMMQEVAMLALDMEGEAGLLSGSDQTLVAGRFQTMLLRSAATRIEGGTDEILRNVLAERVLGLPADVRLDKLPSANSNTSSHH